MQEEFALGIIYDNLVKLISYRGGSLTSKHLKHNEVAQTLNQKHIVIITGERGASDLRGAATILIALLSNDHTAPTKTSQFRAVVANLLKTQTNSVHEMLVVGSSAASSGVSKAIAKMQLDGLRVSYHANAIFRIEAPLHTSVPLHEIAPPDEVNYLCDKYYTSPDKFPIIAHDDVQAIWIGARPGMVVKITRESETAGVAIVYRRCAIVDY